MRIVRIIVFLAVLILIQNASAATTVTVRPSLMVESSVDPSYLMPGDVGTVTITLKNAAKDYTYTVPAEGDIFTLSAQIIEASLVSNDEIQVTSKPFYNVGLLGPGDTIDFTYSFKVSPDAGDGIYFLDFIFVGGGDMYDVRWKVPVTVDSSGLKLINSETSTGSDFIVMDIANTRPNQLKAVTIIPVTDNVEYQPAQYFIGTMDSDELFTIQFDITPDEGIDQVGFMAQFKNGNNWHESDVQFFQVNNSKPAAAIQSKSNPLLIIAILGVPTLVLVIFFVYMRKKRKVIS